MKAIKGHYFPHGVHIPDMKHLSKDCAITEAAIPAAVTIALSQSIGKPSIPVVRAGDRVKTGQLIAQADGAVSSNIFSSISGMVKEITELPNETGGSEVFIVIESDGLDEKAFLPPLDDPSPEAIVARVKEAGIVGLGGASFPTHIKISPKSPVDTLILNGAECEPYLTCDHRYMLEETDKIIRGARYIKKALGAQRILIGIEANKPDCISLFEKYDDVQPIILKKQYPMGSEKHLIYVATKRKVAPGKLPCDVGCVVENVATCGAVCDAIEEGKPLYERVITVSGKAIKEPNNLLVRLGTDFGTITSCCGGVKDSLVKIVRGGPMTGIALVTNKGYTRKASGGLLYLDETETSMLSPTPCLSCGKCADVCPMKLMPMQTSLYAEVHDYTRAYKLGGANNCIECGSCSYICPAKRPLIQNIRKAKFEYKRIMK